MMTERTPWTCRWSEFRPAAPPPIWIDEWLAQWNCLVERRGPATGLGVCAACRDFQPRLARGELREGGLPRHAAPARPARLPMWTLGVGV